MKRPLHTMPSGDGWLWCRNEVATARKRVVARRFIFRNYRYLGKAPVPAGFLNNVQTVVLVGLCRAIHKALVARGRYDAIAAKIAMPWES